MEEKVVASGGSNAKPIAIILFFLLIVPAFFAFSTFLDFPVIPALAGSAVIAFVSYALANKIELFVTDKRVYGKGAFGKRVELPLDSISSVGTALFGTLIVCSSSGVIKFSFLDNRDEIHQEISKLLISRQDAAKQIEIIKQTSDAPQKPDTAAEIKKYKELLDSNVITQEEFDTKKKQLLGL